MIDEERREQEEARMKKMQIDNAERNRSGPVDDSNLVDEMFGFIEEEGASEGAAPAAFKVRLLKRIHSKGAADVAFWRPLASASCFGWHRIWKTSGHVPCVMEG